MPVSVIIPVYDRVSSIGRALDSVLAQSLPAQEIIMIDDGSTDSSADFVTANYPRVKVVRQANRGLSAARNAGIAHAAGEFIAFLDSDDVWLPDKLRVQVEVFAARPELGLLATQKFKNRPVYPIRPVPHPKIQAFPFRIFLKRTVFHPSSVMIPRWILDEIGPFDESLTAAEDRDLWARVAYWHPVARIRQPLTVVFEGADSMSLSRRRKYFNDVHVLAKWNPSRPDSCDVHRRLTSCQYRRYAASFVLWRAMRLRRHVGEEAVREFLRFAETRLDLPPAARALIRLSLGKGLWESS